MRLKDFTLKGINRKDCIFQILYKEKPLLSFHKEAFKSLVDDYSIVDHIFVIQGQMKRSDLERVDIKIKTFIDVYRRKRSEYHGAKKFADIEYKKSSKAYGHFVTALKIIETHNVTYDFFIEAQIDGLDFLLDKKGSSFPDTVHLSTPEAENRLIKYMCKKKITSRKSIVLTQEEKQTPLKQNEKFMKYYARFQDNSVNLTQALYIETCMRERGSKIPQGLFDVIEKLSQEEEELNDTDDLDVDSGFDLEIE